MKPFRDSRKPVHHLNFLICFNAVLNCKLAKPLDCTGEIPVENQYVKIKFIFGLAYAEKI